MKVEFLVVEAKKLHPSLILPKREHGPEISCSVKKVGVQQPIIVRPLPGSEGEYEVIDGLGRVESLDGDAKVLIDVRYGMTDVDAFRTSEATFVRTARTTYERALFYKRWTDAFIRETGSERGVQKRVAEEANISEAEVSHYLSICGVFERLRAQNFPQANFNALKNQAINKLYALAKVEDDSTMLEVAAKMAETPEMALEEVKALIEEKTSPLREIERLVLEDNEKEEESEDSKIGRLTTATQELEGALEKTRETLTVFASRMVGSPRSFLSDDVLKGIWRMVNALKKVEEEANRIIGIGLKGESRG